MKAIQYKNNRLGFNYDDVDDFFCKKKIFDKKGNYYPNKKCLQFYKNNIESNYNGYKNCPYGYTCIFHNKNIISSLAVSGVSNIKLIKGHYSFEKNKKLKKMSCNEFETIMKNIELSDKNQLLSNTFHDLKNSNNYIYDLVDANEKIIKDFCDLEVLLKEYFECYKKHDDYIVKNNIYRPLENEIEKMNEYYNKRNDIYINTIDHICDVTKKIIDLEKNNKQIDIEHLFDFFNFVDYRIRYFKRTFYFDSNNKASFQVRDINLHRIIVKLIEMVKKYSITKKHVDIKFENDNNDYDIKANDDIFLVIFILLENAIKYSLVESYISIKLYRDYSNRMCCIIQNKCENVGVDEISVLLEKGAQGNNSTVGSGLGLYIANEIMTSQGFKLELDYSNYFFSCKAIF